MFDVCIKGDYHNEDGTCDISLPDHYWIPIWEWIGQTCDDIVGYGDDTLWESGLYSANETFIPKELSDRLAERIRDEFWSTPPEKGLSASQYHTKLMQQVLELKYGEDHGMVFDLFHLGEFYCMLQNIKSGGFVI